MKKYVVSIIVAISFIMCASPAFAFSDTDSANISAIEGNTSQIHLDLSFGDAATDWKLFNGSTVQIPSSTGVKRAIKWGLQQVFLYLDSIDFTLIQVHSLLANINTKMDTLNTSIGNVNNAISTSNQYLRNISEKATWIWNDFTYAFKGVDDRLDINNNRLNTIIGHQTLDQDVRWLLPNDTTYTISNGAEIPIINAFGYQTLFTYFNQANDMIDDLLDIDGLSYRADITKSVIEVGSTRSFPYHVGLASAVNGATAIDVANSTKYNINYNLNAGEYYRLSYIYWSPERERYEGNGNFNITFGNNYHVRIGYNAPAGMVRYTDLNGKTVNKEYTGGNLDIQTNNLASVLYAPNEAYSGGVPISYNRLPDSAALIKNQESVASGVMDNEGDQLTQTTTDFDNATTDLTNNENTVFTDIDTSIGKLDFTTTSLSTYTAGFAFVNTTFLMVWDNSQPVRVLITLSCMYGILSLLIGRGILKPRSIGDNEGPSRDSGNVANSRNPGNAGNRNPGNR